MNKQDMQLMFKYNQWANAKILDAAKGISQQDFLADGIYPHGGLRGTLTHALFAEWIWRTRWEGSSPSERLKAEDFPTFESLHARWMEEEQKLMAFVARQTDESLNAPFTYNALHGKHFKRTLWHTMIHLVNHGTQHRAEAAAMLTDLGRSPGDVDLVYFLKPLDS